MADAKINTFEMRTSDNSLGMFFNCKKENIEDAMSQSQLANDYFDVNFYQNLLDGLQLPTDFVVDLKPDVLDRLKRL